MKWSFRITGGLLVLLLLLAAVLWFWRMPVAEWAAERTLSRAGIEDAEVKFTRLGPSGASLELVSPEMTGRVDAEYDWLALLRDRRLETISIRDLQTEIDLAGSTPSIGGIEVPSGSGGTGSDDFVLPFDRLSVADTRLTIRTPVGVAETSVSGNFDRGEGGAASLRLTADRAGFPSFILEDGIVDGQVEFSSDGTATLDAEALGDLITSAGVVREASFTLTGRTTDWRPLVAGQMPSDARLILDIGSASVGAETTPALRAVSSAVTPLGPDLERLTVSGQVEARIDGGDVSVVFPSDTVKATGTGGSIFRLYTEGNEPVYQSIDGRTSAALRVDARTSVLEGDIAFAAEGAGDGGWQLKLDGALDRLAIGGADIFVTTFSAAGSYADRSLSLVTTLDGQLRSLRAGAFTLTDAHVEAKLPVEWDIAARSLNIPWQDNTIVSVSRARIASTNGTMAATLGDIRLTASGDTLVSLDFSGIPRVAGSAVIGVPRVTATIGETTVTGQNLSASSVVRFDNETRITDIDVDLRDGRAVVNEALILRDTKASGSIRVEPGDATGKFDVGRLILAEPRDAPRYAPMRLSGPVTLGGRAITFDFAVATPGGARVGSLEGRHRFDGGRGMAAFDSGEITFARGGLQPSSMIPPLLGIIGETTGTVSVDAEAKWGGGGVETSAVVRPSNLSFSGPGVVVRRTEGLDGILEFENLLPVTTRGAQSLSVASIDFGSIALPDGNIRFSLPGNQSLLIERAVFPLFGGELTTSDATIGFNGESTASLVADNLDLSQMLSFLDVEGLEGEGRIDGVIPLIVDAYAIRVENGRLTATSPGLVRFTGPTARAASASNAGARLAFDVLENLRFDELAVIINGRLDGDLDFNMTFRGNSEVDLDGEGAASDVETPVIFRANVEVPLVALINQARLSRNTRLQIQKAQEKQDDEEEAQEP